MTNCGGAVNERMRKRFPSGRRGGRTGAEAGERAETAPEKRRAGRGSVLPGDFQTKKGAHLPIRQTRPGVADKMRRAGGTIRCSIIRASLTVALMVSLSSQTSALCADRAQPLDLLTPAGRFGPSAQQPAGLPLPRGAPKPYAAAFSASGAGVRRAQETRLSAIRGAGGLSPAQPDFFRCARRNPCERSAGPKPSEGRPESRRRLIWKRRPA